jgi:hypothetical protein
MMKHATHAMVAEIVMTGGLFKFRCPITGMPLFDEGGFDESRRQSPHLRFYADGFGNTFVVDPQKLPPSSRELQVRLVELLKDRKEKGQVAAMKACTKALPPSAVVFEVLDPPLAQFEGWIWYACFDLAPQEDQAKFRKLVPLEMVG